VKATGPAVDSNPFRFSTKYLDELQVSGLSPQPSLYYYGYRYYSPGLGRWVSRDPIGEGGGPNIHAQVGNDPAARVDIDGRYSFSDCMQAYRQCIANAASRYADCLADAGIYPGAGTIGCGIICGTACRTGLIPCGACWTGCTGLGGLLTIYFVGICIDALHVEMDACSPILDNCPRFCNW